MPTNGTSFSCRGQFASSWDSGSETFTTMAIPKPGTGGISDDVACV